MLPRAAERRGERGSVTPLIIGFAVLLLAIITVVIDASAAFLRRQDLDSLADGAALYGADAGAEGYEVYTGGLDQSPLELTRARARSGVRDYLISVGAYADFPGLTYAVEVRGDQIMVSVTASVDLPLAIPGGPRRARVSATGRAVVDPN